MDIKTAWTIFNLVVIIGVCLAVYKYIDLRKKDR